MRSIDPNLGGPFAVPSSPFPGDACRFAGDVGRKRLAFHPALSPLRAGGRYLPGYWFRVPPLRRVDPPLPHSQSQRWTRVHTRHWCNTAFQFTSMLLKFYIISPLRKTLFHSHYMVVYTCFGERHFFGCCVPTGRAERNGRLFRLCQRKGAFKLTHVFHQWPGDEILIWWGPLFLYKCVS